jgi:hypothetical protein
MDVYIYVLLTLALVGGEWSTSRPGRFTPGKRASGTRWIGGWVGPRAGLDAMDRRKILPPQDSNTDPSVVQPVASRYTDCAIPAPAWHSAYRENLTFTLLLGDAASSQIIHKSMVERLE